MRRGLSSLTVRPPVSLDGLSEAAWERLLVLDRALSMRGLKGVITSAKRPSSTPSHHPEGNAIDFVVIGQPMDRVAGELKTLGFRSQFERKGQVNPSGSRATGDHIHVTLHTSKPKEENPFGVRGAATSQASTIPENPFGTKEETNPFGTKKEPSLARRALSTAASIPRPQDLLTALYRGGVGSANSLSRSLVEGARSLAADPPAPGAAPARLLSEGLGALPRALLEGGKAALKREAPEPVAIRTLLGRTPENTNPNLYGGLAVADTLASFLYDPSGAVLGPASRLAVPRAGAAAVKTGQNLAASPVGQALTRASKTEAGEALTSKAQSVGVGRAWKAVQETFRKHDLDLENREIQVGRVARQMHNAEREFRLNPEYEAARKAYDETYQWGLSPFQDLVKALFLQKAGFKGFEVAKELPQVALPPARPGLPRDPNTVHPHVPPSVGLTKSSGPPEPPIREDWARVFAEQWNVPFESASYYADLLFRHYARGIAFLQGTGARAPGQGVRTRYVGLGGKIDFEKTPEQVASRRERLAKRAASEFLSQIFGGERPGRLIGEPGSTAFAGRGIHLFQRAQWRDTIFRLIREGKWVKPVRLSGTEGAALPGAASGKVDPSGKLGVSPGWEYVPKSNVWPRALWYKQVYKPVLDELKARARAAGIADTKKARALEGPELGREGNLTAAAVKVGAVTGDVKRRLVNSPPTLLRSAAQNTAGGLVGAALSGRPLKEFLSHLEKSFQEVITERVDGFASADYAALQKHTRALAQTRTSTIGPAGGRSPREVAGVTGRMVYPPRGDAKRIPPFGEQAERAKRLFIQPNEDMDRAAKLALFKTLRPHLGDKAAAREVEKWLFDPTNRPALFVALDQLGVLPFNVYLFRGAEAAARASLKRPDIPARVGLLAPQMAQAVGATENLEKAPEFRRSPLLIPVTKDLAIDVLSFSHVRDILDVGRILQGLPGNPADTVIEQSLFRTLIEYGTNRRVLGHEEREVVPKGTAPGRARAMKAAHLLYGYTPGTVRGSVRLYESLIGQPEAGAAGQVENPVFAAIRAYLGVPVVKLKSREEVLKEPATEAIWQRRGANVDRFLQGVERRLRSLPDRQNPHFGEVAGIRDVGRLQGMLGEAARELSARSKDASMYRGAAVSPRGQAWLSDQLAWVLAIEDRLLAIAPPP